MTFLETPRFPDDISLGSTVDVGFNSKVTVSDSGDDVADIRWNNPLRSWNVGSGIKNENDIYDLYEFFLVMRGPGHEFRYKDWFDYRSKKVTTPVAFDDQILGTGDGIKTQFQLIKTYTVGSLSLVRRIKKPVADTLRIGVAGSAQSSGWTLDTTTGIITFDTPPEGEITAGYEFDVPAKFEDNKFSISLRLMDANEIPRVMVHEKRL